MFANARSLNNKTDELAALIDRHHAFKNASAIGITESWLKKDDDSINFDGFTAFRTDRDPIATGKSRGGGCLWLINDKWCTNVTVHRRFCSADLELLHVECRPHYLPREINLINLILVYCVPEADNKICQETISDIIDQCCMKHPESATIIAGDFNNVQLIHLNQYVDFNTRKNKKLDLCYSNIPNAYKSYKLPSIGASDHCTIQMVPTYTTKHKKLKRKKVIKAIIDDNCIDACKATFATTDWNVLMSDCIDSSVTNITDYINFTIQANCSAKTLWLNHNSKPWMTRDIKEAIKKLYQAKFQDNDPEQCKIITKHINDLIKEAKLLYKSKTLDKMSTNMKAAWAGIKSMSHLENRAPDITSNKSKNDIPQLAEDLNKFYLRYEQQTAQQPGEDDDPEVCVPDAELFNVGEVRQILKKCIPGKASGPDAVPSNVLKQCADELAEPLCDIYNRCLKSGYIPTSWKHSEIIPVPKKCKPSILNDYRPIALTPIVMKCLEHLIKGRLVKKLKLDEYQFAYRQKRSTKDACLALDNAIRKHLDTPKNYVRILFVDFSSAFNTILPGILADRLKQLGAPDYLVNIIMSFLSNRKQHVKIDDCKSSVLVSNTGAPQGCVLSPFLFSVYTNSVVSNNPSVRIFKYADDMAIVGLMNHTKCDNFYFQTISDFSNWCHDSNLILNTDKTKEMVIDFSRTFSVESAVFIDNKQIEQVLSFKYLGTFFNNDLKWHVNSDEIYKKIKSRFYAFYKFKSFDPSLKQCHYFIQSLILPILLYNSELWFYSCTEGERKSLLRPFDRAKFFCDIEDIVHKRVVQTAETFYQDQDHVLNPCYTKGRRSFISAKSRTSRYRDSFIPTSIRFLNEPSAM